jgi:hypothetical protein
VFGEVKTRSINNEERKRLNDGVEKNPVPNSLLSKFLNVLALRFLRLKLLEHIHKLFTNFRVQVVGLGQDEGSFVGLQLPGVGLDLISWRELCIVGLD